MGNLMPNNNVLFIVEGDSDEVQFLRNMLGKCFAQNNFQIYSYKTNIHILAQVLYNDYPDFEDDDIDIKLVLRSLETNDYKRQILSQEYRDVFLIFDFDPQHDTPHFDTLRRMIAFFNDSTDRGKLFINYPMMQSFKHFGILPDDTFKDRKVNVWQISHYKELVGNESKFTDVTKYSYIMFVSLAVHHIRKANYLLSGQYELPDLDAYFTWSSLVLYDLQRAMFAGAGEVYVLNTSMFLIMDFAPAIFLHQIRTSQDKFDI
jgi:hypothetical protein